MLAGIAVVLELLDDRLRQDPELESIAGAPVLATAIELKGDVARGARARLVTLTHPDSAEADAYHQLRSRTEAAMSGTLRTLLVVPGDETADAAVVSANLAIAWARVGRRVLLINADLRSPRIDAMFGVAGKAGFAQLAGANPASVKQMLATTNQPRLALLAAGADAQSGVATASIASSAFRALTSGEPAGFDLVVVNAPALLRAAESADLASRMDATLLVVRRNGLRQTDLRAMIRALADAKANLVGLVRFQTRRGSHPAVAKVDGKARE